MKTLEIHGTTGHSRILINERLENLKEYLPVKKPVIITDTNVSTIYKDSFPDSHVIEIGTGEKIKTLDTAHDIYGKLLEAEADRSSFIVGIGGGIVCDITGFIASTYMRGIRFGFVSTTLLSQVDASVGGKNGVNYSGYKNMIGVFNQPEFVICDMNMLKTLPQEEILCGFGEIVKHALIGDAGLLSYLEENHKKAIGLDIDVISRLVYDSVVIKSSVVNKDEKESGERKKLNFGHTFGHAIEKTTGILHGQAVSLGMVVAAGLSYKKNMISLADMERIRDLLEKIGLPTTIAAEKGKMIDALKKDKKREGNDIDFVLLDGIGKAALKKISIQELNEVVMNL